MNTIGIIGGMGPQVTSRFYDRLIVLSQTKHGASRNADFPHLIISSLPVPDSIADSSGMEKATAMIVDEAQRLVAAGADRIVMPCNTMHLSAEEIRGAVGNHFISMVDLVCDHAMKNRYRKVAVLGSATTIDSGLYSDPLKQAGIEVVVPDAEEKRMIVGIILRMIAGEAGASDKQSLERIIARLEQAGAKAIILGCTELPLLLPLTSSIPLISSLDLLAEATCIHAYCV